MKVMKVGELKERIKNLDDDLDIVIEVVDSTKEKNRYDISHVETLGFHKVVLMSDELDHTMKDKVLN